jgi:hypothetical protein
MPPPVTPAQPAAGEVKPYEAPDPMPTPPGTPADQALWSRAGEVSLQVTAVRTASSGLQWRIRSLDIVARLAAASKGASGEEAQRLEAVRERLVRAQVENYEILTSRWPVDPTRGCLYAQLYLGSAMQSAEGPDKRVHLGQTRDDAQRCVEAASQAAGRLGRSNETLAVTVDESMKALPPLAATPAPAPTGAAPATAGATASPVSPAEERKD